MPKLRRQKRHLKSLSGNRFPSRTESHVSTAEAVSPTAHTESTSPEVFGRQPSPNAPRTAEMTDDEFGDILESSVTAIEQLDSSACDDPPEILPSDSPEDLVERTDEPLEETDESDPEFDVTIASDKNSLVSDYIGEWVASLDRLNRMSLSLMLHNVLVKQLGLNNTEGDDLISSAMGVSTRTVWEWRSQFSANDGCFPDTLQGKYTRSLLWDDEDLNEQATRYIRANASVKGRPNLTAADFCEWVNDYLLPTSVLDNSLPHQISLTTATTWMHELGFQIIVKSKGIYIDGHEREDVVAYRNRFLRKMTSNGFLRRSNAPSEEAANCLDPDLRCPAEPEKNIIIFHDESIFCSNEDQSTQWGSKHEHFVRPKSKGSGIMVSDFVTEQDGYLRLTDEEYAEVIKMNPTIKEEARLLLEYGENKEGYFNSKKFMAQMEDAVAIANIKYPRKEGFTVYWIFDQSSCHTAYADDALNVAEMNVNPGGSQPKLRDTIFNGKLQRMVYADGTPKGMKQILQERGINTSKMKKQDMKDCLASHPDFKDEKTIIERFLMDKHHVCMFLPKFHCELNPIERCWCQAKRYLRAHCNYTFQGLQKTIPKALDSVQIDSIKKFFRKSREYMFAYIEGHVAGHKLDEQVKTYSSHRRVGPNN